MENKKLVLCCIVGIVLGFLAPFALPVPRSTTLSIGMVAGLGIGYLLDILDEKQETESDSAEISKKARKANQLMERARAELDGRELPDDEETENDNGDAIADDFPDDELSPSEQAEKLNQAEELLRKARERL